MGERIQREFSTGAVRDLAGGKGRFDLLPFRAIREVAIHFEGGAEKYGERNWERGIPLGVYVDSALRHIGQLMTGDHSERHDRAAAWNLLCLVETAERIRSGELPPELDDIGAVEKG
jgi:hypothetical protein